MPCYHPLTAYQHHVDRSISFVQRADCNTIQLPCRQCVGCRLDRSRQWAVRCVNEAKMYENNSFVTLTYDDDHLPEHGFLHYPDFQKFLKRARKRLGKFRFYMAGEYGENTNRPHYHALLFGLDFPDRKPLSKMPSGSVLYSSELLSSLWPHGFTSVGDVTFESAAYVARYVMKKITGSQAKQHYEEIDYETGEVLQRVPEFNKMSLKPGIGAPWFDKFHSDVFPHDRVVSRGVPTKPPRYYDKLAERMDIDLDEIKFKRLVDALSRLDDNTDARLAVKEVVANARLSQLKRSL